VDRSYCDGQPFCDAEYPNDRFVLPIPRSAVAANRQLTQNDGY
jgi:hypothetical protein